MKKNNKEYEKFDATMRQLLKVPHDKIKAELDAEKATKNRQHNSGMPRTRKRH